MFPNIRLIALSGLIAIACQGCMVLSSDGVTRPQPTVGQQLIDLKAAYDKGAINADEYERKKADLLHRPA